MRFAIPLLLCLLAACKGGGDLAPDEFRLDYTRGWADNNFDHRNVDFATDSDAVTVGFSWYLGETAAEREAKRQNEQLIRLTNLLAEERATAREHAHDPAPPPTVIVTPSPTPEPRRDPPSEPRSRSTPEPGACGIGGTTNPKPQHDPTDVTLRGFGGNAMEYLLYTLGALVLAVVAVLKRKYLVEQTTTIREVVGRRFTRKKHHEPKGKSPKGPSPAP